MSLLESTADDTRRTTWSQVEPGFHVANRTGEFIGYIDTGADGSYVAFDGTSAFLGRYPTLGAAQETVVAAARTLPPAQAVRMTAGTPRVAAIAVGTITAAALAAAVIVELFV